MIAFEATGVHIVVGDRFLLVQRPAHKRHPLTWSAVGGKLEEGESAEEALVREVFEETGLRLDAFEHLSTADYEHDGIGFVYHQFFARLDEPPHVTLNDEHIGHGWFTLEEARELPLMENEIELLEASARLM